MDFIVIDDTELAVERLGDGPPLLLVHGLGGPAMWERAAPILAREFEVILPHLPGFGDSPPARFPLGAGGHASLLARFLDADEISGATFAGISWGGEIAARLAASRPDLVRSLVLICPTGTRRYPAPLRSRAVRRALRPILRRWLGNPRVAEALSRRSFHDPTVRPADLVARHLERLALAGRLDALLDAVDQIWSGDGALAALVERLPMPLTLVWGAEDRTVRVSAAGSLRAARPDSEMIVIPACGHSVPLEQPVLLSRTIARCGSRCI